jgi:hypothetical protein
MTEVVDVVTGELLPAEYEPASPAPMTLFGSDDPAAALARMKLLATLLVDVIRNPPDPKVKLVSQISGREFLSAEAWMTLGGMVGVTPNVVWSRPLEYDGLSGWAAARHPEEHPSPC